ncbi:Retinal guanylyl cyclase 1 [Sparganum proliferum]
MQSNTLIRALNLFLRQKGWKDIVILYEVSERVLRYRELAWSLNLYLKTSAVAIILLAGPSISYYFIDMVSNMSIFKNNETAIIQVDPSNIITYDVLRLWRYLLSARGGLGAAAQCTFMMTALPAGHGFDISSYILKSNFKVSLASAAALAIRLTYLNYVDSGGVPPANTSLFARISGEPFSVPVLPNLTYDFSNYDGDTVDFYDLYIFTFMPAIYARVANIAGLHFEELFDLDSVLLKPNWSVKNVYHTIWPSQGRGPQSDSCLLSPCLEDLLWTAPEILRHPQQHPLGTQKGDVYSFAIIAHELFCHSPPFGDCNLTVPDILERIRSGTPVFRPRIKEDSVTSAIKELIEISWAESAECRPTFEQIGKTFHMIGNGRDVNIVDHMLTLMQKYSAKLETEVQERAVKLEEEKQKTEDLIAKMLPLPVAQALVAGNPVNPEAFDDVTIYFSDIVEFSSISAKSTPMQIVDLLNYIYSTFDASIENFDVYKVETIGDAYMVASGLPIRNGKLHAGEVATMALELLNLSGSLSTTIFAAYEDIQEGQLFVLILLRRKLYVLEDRIQMFLERQQLISVDNDEGIIHIRDPELRFVVLEDQRL